MSYCRFSSDNFRSDVYVYKHINDGWVTSLAVRKHLFPSLSYPLDWRASKAIHKWSGVKWDRDTQKTIYASKWRERVDRLWTVGICTPWCWLGAILMRVNPLIDIKLPHAGETFIDDSPSECVARLEHLRSIGYHVPQTAIDRLRAEISQGE